MLKLSANLSFLYQEYEFLDRFHAASKTGFQYVEYMFPYPYKANVLKEKLEEYSLKQNLMNLPAGNWEAGERGIAVLPGRQEEFKEGVEKALEYATILQISCINCLVGKSSTEVSNQAQINCLEENLTYAAKQLSQHNITLLIEPINSYDIPGFFLTRSEQVIDLILSLNQPNIALQYDVYHMQKMEGNLVETMRKNLAHIAHIQIADNPGRHQPGTGEINYRFIFEQLEALNYSGFVGLEYSPEPNTSSSFDWIKSYELRP